MSRGIIASWRKTAIRGINGAFGAGKRRSNSVRQVSKVELRRQAARKASLKTLEQMVSGEIEVYVGYRDLYAQWCTNNSAVPELRPMFSIANIEPNRTLSITEEFNAQIVSIAREILPQLSN
jgi:hypothetical protein